MAQTHEQRLGRWGENVAGFYLEARGFHILARNVRTPHGEVDLVASSAPAGAPGILVFVEVKTRSSAGFGLPEEAVDERKLEHLFRAAEAYMQEHPDLAGHEWRIDVIAIQGKPGEKVEDVDIQHFENISA
ncbi:MAG TPA: YraN family protein [Anaerolineaceae bacterium]